MSAMRYMITIQVPCYSDTPFSFSHKLRTNFNNYDQFVKEIQMMIDSGELRRMVEGMTDWYGGEETMRLKYYDEYQRFCMSATPTAESLLTAAIIAAEKEVNENLDH